MKFEAVKNGSILPIAPGGRFDLRQIKPVIGNMGLILVGGVRTLGDMEKVLSESKADFLSMSRPFIREPFLAKRMKQGKTQEASCISCNKCLAAIFNELPLRCYADGVP